MMGLISNYTDIELNVNWFFSCCRGGVCHTLPSHSAVQMGKGSWGRAGSHTPSPVTNCELYHLRELRCHLVNLKSIFAMLFQILELNVKRKRP